MCCHMAAPAAAASAPCTPLLYAEVKEWQPKDLIAAYCADKAEAERLLPTSTPGSAVRSVVEENQARMDACERQMDMLERALIAQLGRPMPRCGARQ